MAQLGRDRDGDPGPVEPAAQRGRDLRRGQGRGRRRADGAGLGSGHSFTAAAATSGVALDLSGWTGITAADTASGLVTARSGTTLRALNAELSGLGLAMANLGDIDAQTLAGALSTGTHGTGARLGGIATQVEALELVLADGSVVTCSASIRPELFAAARVGLGALGVISAVTLRCVPSFTLLADERPHAGGRGPRAIRRAGRGQRPLRVLLVPLRRQAWSSGTTG
jgi:FAD/FMN-containing dehydrogenases